MEKKKQNRKPYKKLLIKENLQDALDVALAVTYKQLIIMMIHHRVTLRL